MTLTAQPTPPQYSFDNNDPEAHDRHQYLSAMLDDFTFSRLSALGDLTGKRCLEVGAGGGSAARWLAERVGPAGQVVATDFNIKHLPPDASYTVVRNDLTVDPLPAGEWDLIHARLVLMHIPQRREILTRLAAGLAPGGALVLEDWQTSFGELVLAAPDQRAAALVDEYQTTLVERILPANGTDSRWAQRVPAAMVEEGLVDVHTAVNARSWPGGSEGALLVAANIGQLRDSFLQAGLTAERLDELCRLVADPRLLLRGNFTYCTTGYRPAAPAGSRR